MLQVTPTSRAYRPRKALRRKSIDILRGAPRQSDQGFNYFNVKPVTAQFRWAPDRRLMMPLICMAGPGSRYRLGSSSPLYDGHTPSLYAAPTDLGTGDGLSEENAMAFSDAILIIGNGSTGRVLGVLPGVFSASSPANTRWQTCFKPAYSGSSGDPIIIVAKYTAAYNRGSPELFSELRNSNYATQSNPVLGVGESGLDYIRFIGFYADQVYAPPRPSNGTFSIGPSSTGVTFEKCWVKQLDSLLDSDNYNAIYLEGCTDPVLKNNYISGGYNLALNHNAAAFTLYGVTNVLIEHNQFDNVNCGIFVKGSYAGAGSSGTLRFNVATDLSFSMFEMAEVHPGSSGFDVTQNLGVRCLNGLNFDNSVATRCTDIRCTNNTFVDCLQSGINQDSTAAMTNCTNESNIIAFMSATTAQCVRLTDAATPLASDDNLYYEAGGSANARFSQSGGAAVDFTAWKVATSKDAASAEADPGFINAGADNYKRSSYSDGRGCYITGSEEIGLEAA